MHLEKFHDTPQFIAANPALKHEIEFVIWPKFHAWYKHHKKATTDKKGSF